MGGKLRHPNKRVPGPRPGRMSGETGFQRGKMGKKKAAPVEVHHRGRLVSGLDQPNRTSGLLEELAVMR